MSTVICSASFFSGPPHSEAFDVEDVFCVARKVVVRTRVSGGGAFGVAVELHEAADMFDAGLGVLKV